MTNVIRPASIPALLLAALLLAGCSAKPVSQAGVESPAASDASSPAASDAGAASAEPSPGASASPEVSTAPSPTATPAPSVVVKGPPPKPGDPTWVLLSSVTDSTGQVKDTYQVGWSEPAGVASKFLVYGLPECLRDAKKYDGTPCIVPGMKVPVAHLVLLGTAKGDARSMTVSWTTPEGAGPAKYAAILMRATNSFGKSIFTIVHSELVCYSCTY